MVIPFMWVAAIPVEAVTPTLTPVFFKKLMYVFNKKVLPLPADPVRYTLCPSFKMSNASFWVMVRQARYDMKIIITNARKIKKPIVYDRLDILLRISYFL